MNEIPLTQAFAFAEWVGKTHIRLHGAWVLDYHSQTNRNNWRTTDQLWAEFLAATHPQAGRVLVLIPHTPEMRKVNNPALIARMADGDYYRCEYAFDAQTSAFQPSHTRVALPAECAGLEDVQPFTHEQVKAYFEMYVPEDAGLAGLE